MHCKEKMNKLTEETIIAQCIARKEVLNSIILTEFCYYYVYDGTEMKNDLINIITEYRDLKLVWKVEQADDHLRIINRPCRTWKKITLVQSNKKVHVNLKIDLIDLSLNNKSLLDRKFENFSLPLEQMIRPNFCLQYSRFKVRIEVYHEDQSASDMVKDYAQLLERNNFTDVNFVIDDEKFSAHRLVLSARSSVFAAMFNSNMMEKNNGLVEITDIQSNIFKHLLRFIYCSKVDDVDLSELLKLMLAGDKYSIKSLITVCEERISQQLTVDNVMDILITADLARAGVLKKECKEFVFKNRNEVIDTEGYKNFVKSRRNDLLSELFCQIPCKKFKV